MPVQALPAPAARHYRHMQALQRMAIIRARRGWRQVAPSHLSASWREVLPLVALGIADVQRDAAVAGTSYSAEALAAREEYVAPAAFTDPEAFVGRATDGRDLALPLYAPVIAVKQAIALGAAPSRALDIGRARLDRLVRTTIADTARAAAAVDIGTRQGVGYVRMLNPPSCSRCAILAGRFYRWNAGFNRHPHCDCVHVPAKASEALQDEGLIADPYAYFRSLDRDEQERIFGRSEARAINDGADIFQVVNAQRGMTRVGQIPATRARTTSEGTTRRGNFGSTTRRGVRRTVDEIYRTAGTRTRALRMLEEDGYILPGGQNPAGALRGQREGFGALGRGGTRRAASDAVLKARRTGRRDPANRYTMTEAERRVHDADRDWRMVLVGMNPYQAGAPVRWEALQAGRPTPKGGTLPRPLTDADRARAENTYRRYVLGLDGGDPAVRR